MAGRHADSILVKDGTNFEPGDRLTVVVEGRDGKLFLPAEFWGEGVRVEWSFAGLGKLVPRFDPFEGCLVLAGLRAQLPPNTGLVTAEYSGANTFRLVIEEFDRPVVSEEAVAAPPEAARYDPDDWTLIAEASLDGGTVNHWRLALRAARLATHAGFDDLMCLPLVREMDLLEHQIRTAKTVLRRFRGRALLCDEVGLGKTIEAGLVLSELHMRGLARSVLVLVPPSLIEQWQGELRRKFSLDFTSHDDPAFKALGDAAWSKCERVIASVHTAKREPHRSAILSRRWDLIIVDEAHHLRNRETQLWKFASQLQKQYILLLTATPVQNNLEELFNLVTLLEPGLLSTSRQFQKRFVDRKDKLTPRNVDELHGLLAEVMVRNRRSTVGLQFTRRWAKTESVVLTPDEQRLYDDVTDFVRDCLRGAPLTGVEVGPGDSPMGNQPMGNQKERPTGLNRMVLIMLQMALGSSAAAAESMLRGLSEQSRLPAKIRTRLRDLAEAAARIEGGAKFDHLVRLVREFGEGTEKLVIFTQFRATQERLARHLTDAGEQVAVFHGGLSRMEKEAAINRFRGPARLLLATEAGSEGRNLQFAHAICNFDLPWNPMKIEQRIGRLSRIGQEHDVHVFNFVAAGTVESAVLHLLEAKLHMFELVIGEIDMILGNLEEEREFPEVVADLWVGSTNAGDFEQRMEALGEQLLAAKQAYFAQRSHDDRLFGNHFAPEG